MIDFITPTEKFVRKQIGGATHKSFRKYKALDDTVKIGFSFLIRSLLHWNKLWFADFKRGRINIGDTGGSGLPK